MSMFTSREVFKERMIRYASEKWQEDSSVPLTIDPLVDRIIEAFAFELEQITQDFSRSKAKTLERLIQLLLPEIITGPIPAHGIIQSEPSSGYYEISPSDQFLIKKKELTLTQDLYFSPIERQKLTDVSVQMYATKSKVFNLEKGKKTEVMVTLPAQKLFFDQQPVVWLGIAPGRNWLEAEYLSLFWDIDAEGEKRIQLHDSLNFCHWYTANDIPLAVLSGNQRHALEEVPAQNNTQNIGLDLSIKKVIDIYHAFFVHIKRRDIPPHQSLYPEQFQEIYSQEQLQAFKTPLIWVKVTFPQSIDSQFLERTTCICNAFPVVNLRNQKVILQPQHLPVAGLVSPDNEDFWAIQSVVNAEGKPVLPASTSTIVAEKNAQVVRPNYVLLTRSPERIDERQASQMLLETFESIRDEKEAFDTFIRSEIKQEATPFIEKLTEWEAKLKANRAQYPFPFVKVEQSTPPQEIQITYWSCAGALGNDISTDSLVEPYKIPLSKEKTFLRTPTFGGRERMGEVEKRHAFGAALLNRNKLVTLEDVKQFCIQRLGNSIRNIQVKHGIDYDPNPKNGFSRTVEVQLTPALGTHDQWHPICTALASELNKNASGYIPFRVGISPAPHPLSSAKW